jgi:1-acyl-sn-glycerol-3-phosphate acyltransferase
MRDIHNIMAVKELIWTCNAMLFAMITYFIPFYSEVLAISNCRFNHFICRLPGCQVFMYGDEFNRNEKSTIISNHKAMYDILATYYVSGFFNRFIGFCTKKQIAYVPGIGWWCTRMKFPTLNRNISDLKTLESTKVPFPIVIYPEGTRYSDQKYKESYQFAKQNDYPISKYAQLPKYKGAFALPKDVVYHMTLVYLDRNQRIITGEIKEFPHRIYIHVKKHTNVPREESEYKKWIQNQFANIDDIYDNFKPTNAIEMVPKMNAVDYFLYSAYSALIVGCFYYLHSVLAIN